VLGHAHTIFPSMSLGELAAPLVLGCRGATQHWRSCEVPGVGGWGGGGPGMGGKGK
jgi:hypothetical protein